MDYYNENFNTPIPPELQKDWLDWVGKESKKTGRNILNDLSSYDMQGYWLNEGRQNKSYEVNIPEKPSDHYPDTYKKPNHPTFSDDSIYHGQSGFIGGHWEQVGKKWKFTPSKTNLSFNSPQRLFEYFRRTDPDSTLVLPGE